MRRRGAAAAWIAAGVLLAGLPLVVHNSFLLHVCILAFMWTVLGEAWNVLGGYAGQVSFGHAAFFGLGSYVTIILYLKGGVAPWWGIPLGGLAAAAFSIPIGLIAFRLRGPYFSLATLAVAELAKLVALNWEWATNGPTGFLITTLPPLHLFGVTVNWESKTPFYFVAFALMTLSMAAVALLARSRLGAFLVAIRENEEAAEAVGIDTVRAKVLTLALSGFLAGTGGGFYAFYFRYVDPDAVLNLGISMEMVFIAMVGGLGTVAGPLIGAVFLTTVGEAVRERFQVGHLIFYGLFMMLVIRFLPEGIWGWVRKMSARIGAREVRHGAPGG
jgi:branched-chain amino acid transport system permease protein